MQKNNFLPLVEGQLLAYNQRDLDNFCKYYHPEVQLYRLPDKQAFCTGLTQFRQIYGQKFAQTPNLHCQLLSRTILAHTIADEELVTNEINGPKSHVLAIYHFKDDLIFQVWFTK